MPPPNDDRFNLSIDPSTLPPDAASIEPIDPRMPPSSIAGSMTSSMLPPMPDKITRMLSGSVQRPSVDMKYLKPGFDQSGHLVNQETDENPTPPLDMHNILYGPHEEGDELGPEPWLQKKVEDLKPFSQDQFNKAFGPEGEDIQRAHPILGPDIRSMHALAGGAAGYGHFVGENLLDTLSPKGASGQMASEEAALRPLLAVPALIHTPEALKNAYQNPTPDNVEDALLTLSGTLISGAGADEMMEKSVHPIEQTAESMPLEHEAFDGATYDPRTGKSMRGEKQWAVDIAPEQRVVLDHNPTAEDIKEFIHKNVNALAENPNAFIGSHTDGTQHHLELVGLTPNKESALIMGKQLGSDHIYNMATEERLPVGEPLTNAPAQHLPLSVRFAALRSNDPAKQQYVGVHYSDTNKLEQLEGSRRSGSGAEGARLNLGTQLGFGKNAPGGVYVYDKGSLAEAPVASRKHSYEVRGKYALANIEDSPVWQEAFQRGKADAMGHGADEATASQLGLNEAEHALKDAGFDGYFSPKHPNIKFLFGDHKVAPVGAGPAIQAGAAAGAGAAGAASAKIAKPTWKPASPDEADQVTYHGQTVQASPKQIEKALGKPTIEYSDKAPNGKSRTEWDLKDDQGDVVTVFDHHHYGPTPKNQPIEFSIESNRGAADVHKGPTGEFIAPQKPTQIEQEVASEIASKMKQHEGDPFGLKSAIEQQAKKAGQKLAKRMVHHSTKHKYLYGNQAAQAAQQSTSALPPSATVSAPSPAGPDEETSTVPGIISRASRSIGAAVPPPLFRNMTR